MSRELLFNHLATHSAEPALTECGNTETVLAQGIMAGVISSQHRRRGGAGYGWGNRPALRVYAGDHRTPTGFEPKRNPAKWDFR
jgi:hypothetical protein